jgi:protein-disulfide isomerase
VSRAYNARRKARRQAQVAVEQPRPGKHSFLRERSTTLVPVLVIAAILAVVGIVGFGAGSGVSKGQVDREVAGLLDGIPQRGAVLGSPKAPLTVLVFADLECPTVKLFVENHLPSIIETWVRPGVVRLAFRSLKTDTVQERVFFDQQVASLAAGRQDRMWNFFLTFVREQGQVRSGYVTEEFLTGIATQVPGLRMAEWHRDRADGQLTKRVALDVHSAHANELRSTPSLLIGSTAGVPAGGTGRDSLKEEVEIALANDLDSLRNEEVEANDNPAIRPYAANLIGG